MAQIKFHLDGLVNLLHDEPEGHAVVTITYDRLTLTAKGEKMVYKLPDDKKVDVKVSYVDAKGNAASVDGPVEWASSDAAIVSVTVSTDDPSQATVAGVGPVGQAQVTVTADADLGEGVRQIVTTMDVEIIAGEAVAGTISPVGEPTPV